MFFRTLLLVIAIQCGGQAAERVGLNPFRANVNLGGERSEIVTVDYPMLAVSSGEELGLLNLEEGEQAQLHVVDLDAPIWTHFQRGTTVFARIGPNDSLAIIDFSANPPAEIYRGKPDGTPERWLWRDFVIVGARMYIADYQGMTALDISDLAAPRVIRHLPGGESGELALKGEYLYMGVSGTGFAVYKLEANGDPQLQKTIAHSASHFLLSISGNLLVLGANFISGSSFSETWFYDVSDPANPKALGWGPSLQPMVGMELLGDTLYFASSARLRAFDVSEIASYTGEIRAFAPPLVGYNYDFDQGYLQMTAYEAKKMAVVGVGGISFWELQPAAPRLTIRRETGSLRLEWTAPVLGPYEVQSRAGLAQPWSPLISTSANAAEIPSSDGTQFYRIWVVPR